MAGFHAARAAFEAAGIEPLSADLSRIPQNLVAVDVETGRKALRLYDALDDNDDVQNVYANFELPPELVAEMEFPVSRASADSDLESRAGKSSAVLPLPAFPAFASGRRISRSLSGFPFPPKMDGMAWQTALCSVLIPVPGAWVTAWSGKNPAF